MAKEEGGTATTSHSLINHLRSSFQNPPSLQTPEPSEVAQIVPTISHRDPHLFTQSRLLTQSNSNLPTQQNTSCASHYAILDPRSHYRSCICHLWLCFCRNGLLQCRWSNMGCHIGINGSSSNWRMQKQYSESVLQLALPSRWPQLFEW